jgi:pimeloyl-ACP methyl ester carboxylesterase
MNSAYINGSRLAYKESGAGPKSMLFVHGWACDHTIFEAQIDYFRYAHRVVAVDLKGHGASDAPHEEYTVSGFADDLASLCRKLRLDRPTVVGHSMGGTIALDLAARYGNLLSAVVLIDSVILPDPAFVEALRPFALALDGDQYREALKQTVSTLFLDTDDQWRKANLLSAMAQVPQYVLASAFRNHITEYDAAPAAERCELPIAYIASAAKLADLDRFQCLCPQLMVGQTLGSGHFSPLEVPDLVNDMIERFCTIVSENQEPAFASTIDQ